MGQLINSEIVISIITALIAAGAFVISMGFPGGSSDGVPGAGFFPQVLCVVIVLLCALIVWNNIRKKGATKPLALGQDEKRNLLQVGKVFGSALLFVILWGHVLFIANCFIFLLLLGLIFKRKLKVYIPSVLFASFFLYWVFDKILQVLLDG